MKLSTNTHYYDTHLKDLYKKCVSLDTNEIASFDSVIDEIKDQLNKINIDNNIKNNALSCLQLFQNDKAGNYDSLNDINIQDLLPRVWNYIKKTGAIDEPWFYEQLSDVITAGSCSQGRTTRIIQYYTVQFFVESE